jgi:hypothetical protein
MDKFDGKLEFDLTLIPYEGNDNWIDGIVKETLTCLNSNTMPKADENCDLCAYRTAVEETNK